MQVLMFGWEFPPYNSGGLGTACYGLTRHLAEYDVDIHFVLPKQMEVDADFMHVTYADASVTYVNSALEPYETEEHYSHKTTSSGKPYGHTLLAEVARYGEQAAGIAQSTPHDMIHAHDWLTFRAGRAAKQETGKPLIAHIHATEYDRTGGNAYNPFVYAEEKAGMEAADAVITVSNLTKHVVVSEYGINPEKVYVIHNGILPDESTSSTAHPLQEQYRVVLFLGRLTLQKGPDYFLEAAKQVLEYKNDDVLFIMVGSGDMEQQMIEKAADLGIADNVLFAGFLHGETLQQAYAIAHLYVMPSVSEPFGITALESIQNGTPALVSKQSGVGEVLNHALKADFWDIDEMTNKIIALLDYEELNQELVQHSNTELQHITWDRAAQNCVQLYTEVGGAV